MADILAAVRFGSDGLVPAIIQDAEDGMVLMLAYMNRAALERTLQTGLTHFWSRSRQTMWHKGETSGNVQRVVSAHYDCDCDAVLVRVQQHNVACHTGQRSCFHHTLPVITPAVTDTPPHAVTEMLAALYQLVITRRDSTDTSSYVKRLFLRGQDTMAKKVVEEAAEVLLASKNNASPEIIYEMADLWFHAVVLLGYHSIHPHEILRELQRRFGRPGGGKPSVSDTTLPDTRPPAVT